jgi:EAL domain-containing protein (putative c-di-GMP-specific phosphodiesterase class I)/CheY-like chemotaxis protein
MCVNRGKSAQLISGGRLDFELPLDRKHMSGSTNHNSEKPCIQSAFVLDDDPRVGATVCTVLEAVGIVPRQFTNPGPFLTELQESPPDIIFLDLSLGQSDAIEVIRLLESSKYKGKLVLISGRDETTLNEITQIGERRGLAMLPPLKKPFRPADIKQRLFSNVTETKHRKVQKSQYDFVTPKIVVPLAEALGSNWLELWYQPKVDLKSFTVCGAEGLIRARHPVHGIIEPARLLPPAGDPEYWPLSRFVVQRAMADWDAFARQGLHPLLSVNAPVSVISMPAFIDLIRLALPTDPAFPGLIVEVTEDEVIKDSAWVREIANQMKLYNVGMSIDDFGSASASLSRLNDLPFTEVKIDRSFVSGCSSNHLKHSVCQTVIDLAHRFGATVCAEGAETVEDLGALIAMQCDSVQGYVFARPMPAAEFASLPLGGSFESIKSQLPTPDRRGPRLALSA